MRGLWRVAPETNSKLAQLPPLLVLQCVTCGFGSMGFYLGCFGPIPWLGRCEFMAQSTPYIPQSKNMNFLDLSGHGDMEWANLATYLISRSSASSMFFFFRPLVGKLMFSHVFDTLPATLHSLLVVSPVRFPVFIACFIYLELVVWRGPDRQ